VPGLLAEPPGRGEVHPCRAVVAQVEREVAEQRRQPSRDKVQMLTAPGGLALVEHALDQLAALSDLPEEHSGRG
jgi:hypothetical protein